MTDKSNNLEGAESDPVLKPVAFWQLWQNPIILRYMRSRMRWGGMSAALIVTLVVTTFAFLIVYNGALKLHMGTKEDAYAAVFFPIFVIQLLIMMFFGTGAVAGGISQEYEDGMVEYQQLTPMSPMAKIVGYLFGLPIREWFLFGVTSIAMAMAVVKGNVDLNSVWKVYSVFILSILVYHLMALVVVHSMKRKRLAGRVIQFMVLILYFVLPILSQFGFVFFEYLTVRPIVREEMLTYLPDQSWLGRVFFLDGAISDVPFYDKFLNAWTFSMVLQVSLVVTFIVMLRRRWIDSESHLMSKPFALVFYGSIAFMLVGNIMPMAKNGEMNVINNVQQMQIKRAQKVLENPNSNGRAKRRSAAVLNNIGKYDEDLVPLEFVISNGVVFLVFSSLAYLSIYICTPKYGMYQLGIRRARNLKKRWIPLHWDAASGIWLALLIMIMMMVGLHYTSSAFFDSSFMQNDLRDLESHIPDAIFFAAFCLLAFYLVYEAWENKGLFMLVLFIWVLPIMAGLVISVSSDSSQGPINAMWVSAVSPLAGYCYNMMEADGYPAHSVFIFSWAIQAVIATLAAVSLVKKKLLNEDNKLSVSGGGVLPETVISETK